MNALTRDGRSIPQRTRTSLEGAGLLLAVVVAMVALRHAGLPVAAAAWAVAAAGAAGTLAMAALVERSSGWPRWVPRASAGVLAAALLASVPLAGTPGAWLENMRPTAWMFPWFVLVMGTTGDRARAGTCPPARPRAGWMMVTAALAFAAILIWVDPVADWVGTLFRVR